MPGAARLGDTISHGGEITSGSENVSVDGLPVARVADTVQCDDHGAQQISSGSGSVTANGRAVARIGDSVSCGAQIVTGSNDVTVG